MAALSAGIIGCLAKIPRISFSRSCCRSASAARHVAKSRAIAPGFTLAVALMQPTPPARMPWSRKVSLAGKILGARDDAGVGLQQPLYQRKGDRDLGHGRDVVEIDAQAAVTHPLDDFREVPEEPVIRDALVVKGRQHQRATAAELHRVRG